MLSPLVSRATLFINRPLSLPFIQITQEMIDKPSTFHNQLEKKVSPARDFFCNINVVLDYQLCEMTPATLEAIVEHKKSCNEFGIKVLGVNNVSDEQFLDKHGLFKLNPGPTKKKPIKPATSSTTSPVKMPANLISEFPKILSGNVRSGTLISHDGPLIILGDINPGAEVQSKASIYIHGKAQGRISAGTEGNYQSIIAGQCIKPQFVSIGQHFINGEDMEESTLIYSTEESIVCK